MQQLEIEYKILLTQDIFHQILHDYQNKITKDYIQINDYLTHPILSQKKYMLRIRTKNNQYELTLKRPYQKSSFRNQSVFNRNRKKIYFCNIV